MVHGRAGSYNLIRPPPTCAASLMHNSRLMHLRMGGRTKPHVQCPTYIESLVRNSKESLREEMTESRLRYKDKQINRQRDTHKHGQLDTHPNTKRQTHTHTHTLRNTAHLGASYSKSCSFLFILFT